MSESVRASGKKSEVAKDERTSHTRKSNYLQPVDSSVDRILFLQRAIGNQAVSRLIKSGTLQAKLKIGQPDDIYEQEADRVAEQVMRMPEPEIVSRNELHIQESCSACKENELKRQPIKEEEEEEKLQAKTTSNRIPEIDPNIESYIRSLNGGGQPLSEDSRAFFEPRCSYDFSQVRVHTDVKAAESAQALNAAAFTIGRNVVFAQGRYAPETISGKSLLAHELAHVVQQTTDCYGPESIKRQQFEPDPRAAVAAQKAYEMKQQSEPGIWFDDWNDDERDNNLDGVIDDPAEGGNVGSDGIHFDCFNQGKAKCQAGVYEARICSASPVRRTDDSPCSEQHHSVRYRVCIDIPIKAYHNAGLLSFPDIRDVNGVKRELSGRRDWKVFYSGEGRLHGDFVANSQHSGIVYQGDIIHLPGQTARRQHYGSALPSRRNDIEMTSDLWHGGINFRARPIKGGRGKGHAKTVCIPIESPPILGGPAFATANRHEGSRAGRVVAKSTEPATQRALLGSDLVGLMLNDGFTYGTWNRRPRVERLQYRLVKQGAALEMDGKFGDKTAAALHQFQATVGLPEQDVVDQATADALEGIPEPDQPSAISELEGLKREDGITYGTWDRRPRVHNLQSRLTATGFPCTIDGMFGSETADALHGFQIQNGLLESDEVDRSTADTLEGHTRGGGDLVCPRGEIPVPVEGIDLTL
jgi:peptidoglycan hydrolase-like protein with peptidoglycan-binding domain